MRMHFPGVMMIPTIFALLGTLAVMRSFGIIQIASIYSLWPATLIATGLEELYLWARRGQ